MNPNDEEGIDRAAWRRRLGDAGEPAPITGLRIRAEARRAVTPRIGYWWLPASLAATLVLAVFVVQWQIEDAGRAPIVRESDMAVADAPAQEPAYMVVPPPTEEAPAPMIDLPVMEAEAPPQRETTRAAELERNLDELAAAPAPREERAVTSAAESAADQAVPATPPAPAAEQKTAPATGALQNITVTGTYSQRTRANAALRTPEQWYADIEALRKAGKDAEADAELERLEEAYPGWLARQETVKP